MNRLTRGDLGQLANRAMWLMVASDPAQARADEEALIRHMRRCLQTDDAIPDDELDRYLDAVLQAAGSALRHYTMQKSLDDMRAAMRAAMTPVPLFDSQCRELCAALGWQGGTYHLVLAEVKRLKAADAAPHAGIIRELLNIAALAWRALDDSEEVETPDGRGHVISDIDFDALTQAFDELDELPDDQPGVTMSPAMKAAWTLRQMLAGSVLKSPAKVTTLQETYEVRRIAYLAGEVWLTAHGLEVPQQLEAGDLVRLVLIERQEGDAT